jgi:hypothetical protein
MTIPRKLRIDRHLAGVSVTEELASRTFAGQAHFAGTGLPGACAGTAGIGIAVSSAIASAASSRRSPVEWDSSSPTPPVPANISNSFIEKEVDNE